MRDLILARDGHRCVAVLSERDRDLGPPGSRCPNTTGLQADHIVNDATARRLGWSEAEIHDPENGQTLCARHHDAKSQAERTAGIRQYHGRRYRKPERHPGLVDPPPDSTR